MKVKVGASNTSTSAIEANRASGDRVKVTTNNVSSPTEIAANRVRGDRIVAGVVGAQGAQGLTGAQGSQGVQGTAETD